MKAGFICQDLQKDIKWPLGKNMTRRITTHIDQRTFMKKLLMFDQLGLEPDEKTKQWWGKFCVTKDYFDFHMYVHHVARQVIEHVDRYPELKNDWVIQNRVEPARKQYESCRWKKPSD